MARLLMCTAALLLVFLPELYSLEWTPGTVQETAMTVCSGHNLELDWSFVVDDTETVEDIRWDVVSDRSQELIALSVQGNFNVMPAFSGRVSHQGNASLTLNDVTLGDAGNYSVEINAVRHGSGTFSTTRHTAHVIVADPPSSRSDGLTVTQQQQAVFDAATDSYHVQLTCGVLDDLGFPPVGVVWQTPSGSQEVSTSRENGTFYLQLKNPVQGGNYSCGLPTTSPAALCLKEDDPLLEKTTLFVDGVMVRLSMLEAKEETLRTANKRLTEENNFLKEEVNKTHALLQESHSNLTAELYKYRTENAQLVDHVQTLETHLNDFYNKSLVRPSFDARHNTAHQYQSADHIKFQQVLYNDGNGYNQTTGDFTAPVGGTYFFIFTTSPYGSNGNKGDTYLSVDGTQVAWVAEAVDNFYDFATTHAIFHLRTGQRVWVESWGDRYVCEYSKFCGFLLTP